MVDFSKFSAPESPPRPVDPLKLFKTLQVSDPDLNDLWLAQGDALREWQQHRDQRDVVLTLNTGAGKSLIGLLIAQSLTNETNSQVVYACSSIQLVEQTAEKAGGYGIPVTTYTSGSFNNGLYNQALAPCITTYHALFNGKARFERDELAGVLFDDAHTAESIIRDQYTLTIKSASFPALYSQLTAAFLAYHERVSTDMSYREIVAGTSQGSRFIPPFAVHEKLGTVKKALSDAGLGENKETLFAWEHVRDYVDRCCFFVSPTAVSLTPVYVPILDHYLFGNELRRVYLSATLRADDGFIRTFGRPADRTISPDTNIGKCERMVLIPNKVSGNDVATTIEAIRDKKALVLVPTYKRAERWSEVVEATPEDVPSQVRTFRTAPAPAKQILVARYDGVDLPGDSCRIMVIDDLPAGLGPLERYLFETLQLDKTLRSTLASRVVQSFGRISRGLSDHGVVFLTGKRLLDWLHLPKNREAMDPFLRRQIELGMSLSEQLDSPDQLEDVLEQCLTRERSWLDYYQKHVPGDADSDEGADSEATELAQIFSEFGHQLWRGNFARAAKLLESSESRFYAESSPLGAWITFWRAHTLLLAGDRDSAIELFQRARSACKALPAFDRPPSASGDTPDPQLDEIARRLYRGSELDSRTLDRFDKATALLDGSGSTNQTEEAVRELGAYLGLDSSRPDNDHDTGPDVLWFLPDELAWSMELKTDKDVDFYSKYDVMQLADHVRWVSENKPVSAVLPIFVGPDVRAHGQSNPPDDARIIELSFLLELRDRVRAALDDVLREAVPLTLKPTLRTIFGDRGLLWGDLSQTQLSPLTK